MVQINVMKNLSNENTSKKVLGETAKLPSFVTPTSIQVDSYRPGYKNDLLFSTLKLGPTTPLIHNLETEQDLKDQPHFPAIGDLDSLKIPRLTKPGRVATKLPNFNFKNLINQNDIISPIERSKIGLGFTEKVEAEIDEERYNPLIPRLPRVRNQMRITRKEVGGDDAEVLKTLCDKNPLAKEIQARRPASSKRKIVNSNSSKRPKSKNMMLMKTLKQKLSMKGLLKQSSSNENSHESERV